MNEKTFLEAWLNNLEIVLKDTQNNIEKLESNEENNRVFADIQTRLMMKWLSDEALKSEVREDMEGILTNVKNREQENKEQLEHLKVVEESTSFMIDKIKKELDQ